MVRLLACASVVSWLATPAAAGDDARFYGVWGQDTEACASYTAGMEGNYLELRPGSFITGGDGSCENAVLTVEGDTLTVTAICSGEGIEPESMRSVYRLSGELLINEYGHKMGRCPP